MIVSYFTRDCAACPFWDNGRCTMTAECSTFNDLFGGGEFISVRDTIKYADGDVSALQDAYYVDCDGMYVGKVEGEWFNIALTLARNLDIVGILIPKVE